MVYCETGQCPLLSMYVKLKWWRTGLNYWWPTMTIQAAKVLFTFILIDVIVTDNLWTHGLCLNMTFWILMVWFNHCSGGFRGGGWLGSAPPPFFFAKEVYKASLAYVDVRYGTQDGRVFWLILDFHPPPPVFGNPGSASAVLS